MQQLTASVDFEDLDMAAIKYASMQARLYCITVLARDDQIIFSEVAANYARLGRPLPTPQLFLPICNACLGDLVNGAGDLIALRRIEEQYNLIFQRL